MIEPSEKRRAAGLLAQGKKSKGKKEGSRMLLLLVLVQVNEGKEEKGGRSRTVRTYAGYHLRLLPGQLGYADFDQRSAVSQASSTAERKKKQAKLLS